MSRLVVSFSGGETSGFMAQAILRSGYANRYDEVVCLFANTGQENEETLVFADKCDKAFGMGLVWVEAVVQHDERKAPEARVVTFETAARNGQPFEDVIRKYGIPNQAYKHCTRTLKLSPMTAYLRGIGWEAGSYDTAIGIRADEFDRISVNAKESRLVYPLIESCPTTKPAINSWWDKQPFRLGLKGYQGNCRWCWKKSFRKHLTILRESPEAYDFPRRMEAEYGLVGPEFLKEPGANQEALPEGYRRTFFRGGRDVAALEQMARDFPHVLPADDDANVYDLFDAQFDVGGGCEESCEVFADEDQEAA